MQWIKSKKVLMALTGFLIVCFLCTGAFVIKSIAGHNGVKPSSQSDYPILPDTGAMISYLPYESLEQLTEKSDLIIQGTVSKVLPAETNTYTPEEGTADLLSLKKAGGTGYEITSYPVQITINQTVKGDAKEKTITLRRSDITMDAQPELKEGDELMFFLHKFETREGYVPMGMTEGYFYVAADDKVYPSKVTDGLKNTSGMSLDQFKSEVKGYASK